MWQRATRDMYSFWALVYIITYILDLDIVLIRDADPLIKQLTRVLSKTEVFAVSLQQRYADNPYN